MGIGVDHLATLQSKPRARAFGQSQQHLSLQHFSDFCQMELSSVGKLTFMASLLQRSAEAGVSLSLQNGFLFSSGLGGRKLDKWQKLTVFRIIISIANEKNWW